MFVHLPVELILSVLEQVRSLSQALSVRAVFLGLGHFEQDDGWLGLVNFKLHPIIEADHHTDLFGHLSWS